MAPVFGFPPISLYLMFNLCLLSPMVTHFVLQFLHASIIQVYNQDYGYFYYYYSIIITQKYCKMIKIIYTHIIWHKGTCSLCL